MTTGAPGGKSLDSDKYSFKFAEGEGEQPSTELQNEQSKETKTQETFSKRNVVAGITVGAVAFILAGGVISHFRDPQKLTQSEMATELAKDQFGRLTQEIKKLGGVTHNGGIWDKGRQRGEDIRNISIPSKEKGNLKMSVSVIETGKKGTGPNNGDLIYVVKSYNPNRGHIQDTMNVVLSCDVDGKFWYSPSRTGRMTQDTDGAWREISPKRVKMIMGAIQKDIDGKTTEPNIMPYFTYVY